ncbi:MAG: hypothetical protein E7J93_03310 [Veillonella sp.]|uniref:hypothetical protein n=1 Tax=Veillonella sp. TaxID=1926307 RepID=UPI002908B2BA|nr:hypothetical protein [Veillonella sp.]MDU7715360.1 hypothetical protein [Veillonella sp.]
MGNHNFKIVSYERKHHSKASEEYLMVNFNYANEVQQRWVPVEYRRTGVSIRPGEDEKLISYLNKLYNELKPENYNNWLTHEMAWWDREKKGAGVTREFFNALADGKWKCQNCELPNNPNWARRIQDLKEYGYTIATDTKRYCEKCKSNRTHLMLLPVPRCINNGNGYETWSPKLRKHILKTLNNYDVYEAKISNHCLPDHKFSEIRWDEDTKSENSDDMSDEEIRAKFQLLSNQRNQQKREVCRECFQTGKRGTIYGISFFYEGSQFWDKRFPPKGKDAEAGCIGCAWYDIAKWREELINVIKKASEIKEK